MAEKDPLWGVLTIFKQALVRKESFFPKKHVRPDHSAEIGPLFLCRNKLFFVD